MPTLKMDSPKDPLIKVDRMNSHKSNLDNVTTKKKSLKKVHDRDSQGTQRNPRLVKFAYGYSSPDTIMEICESLSSRDQFEETPTAIYTKVEEPNRLNSSKLNGKL